MKRAEAQGTTRSTRAALAHQEQGPARARVMHLLKASAGHDKIQSSSHKLNESERCSPG
jgi:hypothetical protein